MTGNKEVFIQRLVDDYYKSKTAKSEPWKESPEDINFAKCSKKLLPVANKKQWQEITFIRLKAKVLQENIEAVIRAISELSEIENSKVKVQIRIERLSGHGDWEERRWRRTQFSQLAAVPKKTFKLMGGKGFGKKNKTGGRRSSSSENSQGTPEPKRTDKISRMADMTEDDVVAVTSENTANGVETRSHSQDPALAAIWEAVVQIEANTNLLVSEHKELKILCEELRRSLQFTQAEVDDTKKETRI